MLDAYKRVETSRHITSLLVDQDIERKRCSFSSMFGTYFLVYSPEYSASHVQPASRLPGIET